MISPRRRGGRPCGVSLVWAQPCDALCRHSPDCHAPEKPRLLRSSTRRASRPPQRGRCARPAGSRCGRRSRAASVISESTGSSASRRARTLPRDAQDRDRMRELLRQARRRFPSSIASSPTPDARVEYGEDDRRHRKSDNGHRPALRPPAFRAKAPDRRPEPRADEPQSTSQAPYRTLRQHRRLHAPCLELHDPQPWRRP